MLKIMLIFAYFYNFFFAVIELVIPDGRLDLTMGSWPSLCGGIFYDVQTISQILTPVKLFPNLKYKAFLLFYISLPENKSLFSGKHRNI